MFKTTSHILLNNEFNKDEVIATYANQAYVTLKEGLKVSVVTDTEEFKNSELIAMARTILKTALTDGGTFMYLSANDHIMFDVSDIKDLEDTYIEDIDASFSEYNDIHFVQISSVLNSSEENVTSLDKFKSVIDKFIK